MSDKDNDLSFPSMTFDNRWVVNNSSIPLPKDMETIDEIPLGRLESNLPYIEEGEEEEFPDPLEYFSNFRELLSGQ